MSAPAALAIITATVVAGGATLHLASQVEVRHRAAATAESAALAAADAHFGWIDANPCELATLIASRAHLSLSSCMLGQESVTVEVRQETLLGAATGSARAGIDPPN